MAAELPSFVRAMQAVAADSSLSLHEAAVISAAVRWVNFRTGELWPSVGEWCRGARISDRGFHGIVRKLSDRGLVQVLKPSKGGRGQTAVYRIPMLAVDGNPEAQCGVSVSETPKETPHETPNGESGNPERRARNPEPVARNPERQAGNPAQLVRTNSQEQPENSPRELSSSRASGSADATTEATKPTHPVARFLADRANRTGDRPPGFARFLAAYPQGRAKDAGGLLVLWGSLGLEDAADAVLAGLEAWKASDDWREGYAVGARKFLTERHWETVPPPHKPARTALGGAW